MFNEWLKERDEAVSSLDLAKFKAFYEKWLERGIYQSPLPADKIAEIAMYKYAIEITKIPKEVKEKAAEWLTSHGYVVGIG
jgi:hypothetical protein